MRARERERKRERERERACERKSERVKGPDSEQIAKEREKR